MGKSLVSSQDVEGTDVYSRRDRQSIGKIHHLMIDKLSGNVAYADMSFGGLLGIGESHYPVPWNALTYDPALDGFVADITESQIEQAPSYDNAAWEDRKWETQLHEYYGAPVYWGASSGADTTAGVESNRMLDPKARV